MDAASLNWIEIREELVRHSCRYRKWQLPAGDLDDVVQEAALRVLASLTSDPSAYDFLLLPAQRAAWLGAVVRNIARERVRERIRHTLNLDGPRQAAEESGHPSNDDSDLLVMKLRAQIPSAGAARMAFDVLTGTVTLVSYAAAEGVSDRTARRHFARGKRLLQELARHLSGDPAI